MIRIQLLFMKNLLNKTILKLGDEVDLELLDIEKSGKIKSHKFKIIGSFSGKKTGNIYRIIF